MDIWGEAAVLAICRNEIAKLSKKLQYGYCVFPLHHVELLAAITKEIPPVLISTEPEFLVRTDSREGEVSAAFRTFIDIRRVIRECFAMSSDETFEPTDPRTFPPSPTPSLTHSFTHSLPPPGHTPIGTRPDLNS